MDSSQRRLLCFVLAGWLPCCALLAGAGVLCRLAAVRADSPNQSPFQTRREGEGLIPPSDVDAESWLKRAADAAADGQWKLAADTLSRVIEQYADRTVSLDGRVFVSAASAAQAQIAAWPEDGLATYRLLFDPIVNEKLSQARSRMDVELLRDIARNYRMASRSPEALSLLATLLLDRQQAVEALDVLEQLQRLPHNDVPRWQTLQQTAVACMISGRLDDARETIEALKSANGGAGGGVPADWHQRLASIERWIAQAQIDRADSDGAQDDELDPAVTPEALWQDAMPGSSRLSSAAIAQLTARTGRPPVWQAARQGGLLFITCPDGVMARDAATIELLWKSHPRLVERDPRIEAQRRLVRMYQSDNSGRLDELSTRSVFHEYRGALSAAHGLVFVIDQGGTTNEVYPSRDGQAALNDSLEPEANSIRAFEAQTGRARWTIGRGGRPGDELRFVHFYSPPIAVGDLLAATFQEQNDLCLGVFDAQGALHRRVLLGTADKAMFPINVVLTPAVDETTLYVPTATGLLVALSRHDFGLRWLAMYDRSRRSDAGPSRRVMPLGNVQATYHQPDEWLSSPPLCAGRLVVLAPQDADYLLAFDRSDGSLRWSFPRGDHRSLVGVAGNTVVVAGSGLLAIDLDSGRGLWSYSKSRLIGRPAIHGRRTFVPTERGLEVLDARTGEPAGSPRQAAGPLGNLYVFDGSLYSIGAKYLTKYPDLARSRAAALAQIAQSPDDPSAYIRLAWIEKLDGKWEAALSLLDRADACVEKLAPGPDGDSPRANLRARVARQRVQVLLRLAESVDADTAEDLIARAVQTAMAPDDVLAAGLMHCDFLADRGQASVAFEKALALLTHAGDETLASAGELRISAAVALGERLHRWWNAADPPERDAMQSQIERQFAAAMSGPTTEPARRISDAAWFAPVSARLDVAVARRDWAEASLENAVFHLERAARQVAAAGATRLEALVLLFRAYADPGQGLPRSPAGARRVLARLIERHGGATVPDTLAELPTAFRGRPIARLHELCPPQWAVASPAAPSPAMLDSPANLELVDYEVTTVSHPSDVAAFWDARRDDDTLADMHPVRIMRQVRGVNLASDADANADVFWACGMEPLLEAPADQYGARRVVNLRLSDGASAGRVALMQSERQINAVGLLSGMAAWPPIPLDSDAGELPRPSIVEHDGVFLFATQANVLTAAPARMNAAPLWRRTFGAHRLGSLAVVDGQFVAIDQRATTVFVIDPSSGRIRRQFDLVPGGGQVAADGDEGEHDEDGDSRDRDASATIVGSVVCNAAFKKVIGRDVATGRVLWEREMDGRVKRVLPLGDGTLGVCHRGGRLAILAAGNGQVIADLKLDGLLLPPADAVVEGLSSGARPATGGDRGKDGATAPDHDGARLTVFTNTDDDPPEYVIASYSLATKSLLWKRNVGRFAIVNERMIRASPRYLPLIEYRVRPDAPRRLIEQSDSQLDVAAVHVLDKVTGRSLLAEPYVFDRDRAADEYGRGRLFTDLVVMNDSLVAVAAEGYYVLRKAAASAGDAGTGDSAGDTATGDANRPLMEGDEP